MQPVPSAGKGTFARAQPGSKPAKAARSVEPAERAKRVRPAKPAGPAAQASPPSAWPPAPVRDAVLVAALAALRAGTLDALLLQRPTLARGLSRRLLAPLQQVAGNGLAAGGAGAAGAAATAWRLLLRARLAELRPDGQPGLHDIAPEAWQQPGRWRALLALACHLGLMAVPQVPGQGAWRARSDEPAAEQLCSLWDVAASTVYRSVDQGRRLLAAALAQRTPASGAAALRRLHALQHEVHALLGLDSLAARAEWHRQQAQRALASRHGPAVLWHHASAGDPAGFAAGLQRWAAAVARQPETDALVQQVDAWPLDAPARVQLALARAALARVRGHTEAEREACEHALHAADAASSAGQPDAPLLLARAYGALGRHHEQRDADRARACFEESAELLHRAGLAEAPASADPALLDEYVNTLVRLAWWHALRNDPRALPLLERAQALDARSPRGPEAQAMLAQVAGEYWRRSGDLARALEHKYRALHLYERLGYLPGVLKTYGNLSLIHAEAKDFARAIDYSQRVLDIAARTPVESETVAATHLNLGVAYFCQSRWDPAIHHYGQALDLSRQARLRVQAGRAHYNLAEAYYKRFLAQGDADDEQRGDAHAAASLATWQAEGDSAPAEATRRLKGDILGPGDELAADRLLPAEVAAHFAEMLAVQRHRAQLALPLAPDAQAEAHLAIARAYLAVSVKEREAAQALIDRHGLAARFADALGQLHSTFHRALSREQQLSALWRAQAADLLSASACEALLRHLLAEGAVNKSAYAPLVGVGLATASKHLGLLAARGLLVQSGRGPSTRYALAP